MKLISPYIIALCVAITPVSIFAQALDQETQSTSLQPFKRNYILFNPNRGTDDDGEFKIQISFLTQFKALEFEKDVWGIDVESSKTINLGFNYTQTFFNDFGRESAPIVSTDYLPGLFISVHSQESAIAGFKQFSLGWEHQSNGEYEGALNRSWDRGYGELLLGFGRPFERDNVFDQDTNKTKNNYNAFSRTGSDHVNFRARASWPINISEDNRDLRDFYGVYELEISIRNKLHEARLLLIGGHKKTSTIVEVSTKRVPLLSDANKWFDKKYRCQDVVRSGLRQRLFCITRYIFAPFDLVDNHGAWLAQYFNGYGERIRDYNLKEEDAVRLGYRFFML